MSVAPNMKPVTVSTIMKYKKEDKKITMLTSYDCSTARYVDEAGIDTILVGDSLGMVVLGYDTTLKVTLDEMKIFTSAVSRGAKRAMVIADMPFMSYHSSIEKATENAGELIRAGAQAVKIEGGTDYIVEVTKHLNEMGIPVVAHLGFTPQYLNTIGGYSVQGKSFDCTVRILEQAKKLQNAGAFMLVLEMVPEESAKYITEQLEIPTIGIGAGRYTSGQVLVVDDILGKYGEFKPKFARKYADMKSEIFDVASRFRNDVENGLFPNDDEVFKLNDEQRAKLEFLYSEQN